MTNKIIFIWNKFTVLLLSQVWFLHLNLRRFSVSFCSKILSKIIEFVGSKTNKKQRSKLKSPNLSLENTFLNSYDIWGNSSTWSAWSKMHPKIRKQANHSVSWLPKYHNNLLHRTLKFLQDPLKKITNQFQLKQVLTINMLVNSF